jgi:hypothetical protein
VIASIVDVGMKVDFVKNNAFFVGITREFGQPKVQMELFIHQNVLIRSLQGHR